MGKSRILIGGMGAALLACLVAAGCARQESVAPVVAAPVTAATLPPGLTPEASILDLMLEVVDPNATDLWNSVGTVSTTRGQEERTLRTDAEWSLARRRALLLAEAANMLVVAGRPVAHPGQQLKDPPGEGDFTPAQAQVEIDKERAGFNGFAAIFQGASRKLLVAIDKRDVEAFQEAGGDLDEACESCHKRFWYPKSPSAPAP
jgi:hypothetical protein